MRYRQLISAGKKTILISGAGGAAAPCLIESSRTSGFNVIAADMDPSAAGLFIADKGIVIPAGTSRKFLPALREICIQEKVDAVIPLVDEELESALGLEHDGAIVLLPKLEFVKTCLDKFVLMQQLERHGIGVPRTRLASEGFEDASFPLVIKPRTARGSRGLGIIESESQLEEFLRRDTYGVENLLVQEFIKGPEFTVSVVVWRDGEVQAVVPKEIIAKQGITRMAVTRHNQKIEQACYDVQEALRADGPFNVQLRLDSDANPRIFEINPRFSTTTTLTMASGIDECCGLLMQAFYGREHHRFGDWRDDMVLMRQTLDRFVDEREFIAMSQKIKDIEVS